MTALRDDPDLGPLAFGSGDGITPLISNTQHTADSRDLLTEWLDVVLRGVNSHDGEQLRFILSTALMADYSEEQVPMLLEKISELQRTKPPPPPRLRRMLDDFVARTAA